ncbi:MAG: NIPSNAP family protein [Pseudomonadota bacterium]
MRIYERRTYSIRVGQMPEVLRLYRDEGWPALEQGGFGRNLVGYFVSDTGRLHQLMHLWRFDSDEARRDFWQRLFADEPFMKFAVKIRPLIEEQEIQLFTSAPWGPQP